MLRKDTSEPLLDLATRDSRHPEPTLFEDMYAPGPYMKMLGWMFAWARPLTVTEVVDAAERALVGVRGG